MSDQCRDLFPNGDTFAKFTTFGVAAIAAQMPSWGQFIWSSSVLTGLRGDVGDHAKSLDCSRDIINRLAAWRLHHVPQTSDGTISNFHHDFARFSPSASRHWRSGRPSSRGLRPAQLNTVKIPVAKRFITYTGDFPAAVTDRRCLYSCRASDTSVHSTFSEYRQPAPFAWFTR